MNKKTLVALAVAGAMGALTAGGVSASELTTQTGNLLFTGDYTLNGDVTLVDEATSKTGQVNGESENQIFAGGTVNLNGHKLTLESQDNPQPPSHAGILGGNKDTPSKTTINGSGSLIVTAKSDVVLGCGSTDISADYIDLKSKYKVISTDGGSSHTLSANTSGNIVVSSAANTGIYLTSSTINFKEFNELSVSGELGVHNNGGSFTATGSTVKITSNGRGGIINDNNEGSDTPIPDATTTVTAGKLIDITATVTDSGDKLRYNNAVGVARGVMTLNAPIINITVNNSNNKDNVNAIKVADGTLNLNATTANITGNIDVATGGTLNLNGNLIFNGEEAYINTLGGNQATITLTNKDQDFHIVDNNNNALTITADSKVVSTIEGLKDIARVDNDASNVTWFIDGGLDGDDITEIDGKTTYKTSKGVKVLKTFGTSLSKVAVLSLKNDVRKRLGDIRHVDAEQGAWVRYEGGRMSASGYSNKLNTLQIGYDTKALADGVRLGAAVSYTRNDGEMDGGAVDGDTYALSLYGTWMGDNGMYADVIGRVASVKNDVTVLNGSQAFNDDMTNTAYSITGEFGQRFDIAKTFFVEPQVEMVYTYVDSGKLKLNSGNYKYDSIDSLIGRAGMVFGWNCPNDKGHVYFRASALHEFKGDSKLTTNRGNTYKTDGQDTWAELGLGAQYNVNKNIHVWADVERTQGADINEDFRGTLGVRVSF